MDTEDKYYNLPIPTYEEATSSRPTSSQNYRGPEEVSDDAERQGLLGQHGYRPPTVESPRSSVDSDLRLPEMTGDGEDARRQIEELDYLDPSADANGRGVYHRARLRGRLGKHLANISATFSSLRLPSFRSLYTPVSTDEDSTTTGPPPTSSRGRSWLSSLLPQHISIPDQYRLSAPTFARLCGLFTIAAIIYILFALDMFPNSGQQFGGNHFNPGAVRQFVQEQASNSGQNIAAYLKHITSYDHVAGTEGDLYMLKWMQEQWWEEAREGGMMGGGGLGGGGGGFDDVRVWEYFVYLNYPTKNGRSVRMMQPANKKWEAKLEEGRVEREKQQTWAWHGYSRSGEAKGHLIYANGGSRDDFAWLEEQSVETEGAIALVRYYRTQPEPGLKIKAAEEAGCLGVLLYSDPSDDGAGQGKVWPDGRWRPADSLQRSSVGLSNWVLGDPLTPGWASTKHADRISSDSSPGLPGIPSLPLAWRDAKELISALDGQGVEVPQNWMGGTSPKKGRWYTGSQSSNAPVVELRNHNDENEKQEIWNLHAQIHGLETPSKKLIVGTHRDAWCFGSSSPGSGTAVLMEVVAIFKSLMTVGWRPLRTIEFVSWDAGAFGMVGSTEFVEDHAEGLREDGIAYLDVGGAAVWGQDFHAAGSPLLKKALMHVLNRVTDPATNDSLKHLWKHSKSALTNPKSRKSDTVPFTSIVGTSSLDFGFHDAGNSHAYLEGSCYDSFAWTQKFGDHGFEYHRTLAQIWALLILELADRPLIPFDLKDYADAITLYVKELEQFAIRTYGEKSGDSGKALNAKLLQEKTNGIFDLQPLKSAASNLSASATQFHEFEDLWSRNVMGAGGLESANFAIQRLHYNDKIAHFESDLLDLPYGDLDDGVKNADHGIPRREQYKHVLYGPRASGGNGDGGGREESFPAVRDAVEEGDWEGAMELVERAARVIERAARRLGDG